MPMLQAPYRNLSPIDPRKRKAAQQWMQQPSTPGTAADYGGYPSQPQGLLTNQGAARLYDDGSRMPITTTAGGNWGRPATNPMNKLMQANTAQELGMRIDNVGGRNRLGMTPTLNEAAYNPNYNANGAMFQGAGLGVNPNGSAYFRDRSATTYAGGAANEQQAAANRLAGMQNMERRDIGYIDPQTGAFMGKGPGAQTMEQQRGRLAAGGLSPTTLTADQLSNNRLAMLQRLAGKRESAMNRVTQMAAASTADRRARLNPNPLQQMLSNNPQAAMQWQAMQAQQAHQLALQGKENEGKVGAAKAMGEAGAQEMDRKILGALAANGNPEALKKLGFGGPEVGGAQQLAKPGTFAGGIDEQSYNGLKEFAKTATKQEAYAKIVAMGVPYNKRSELIQLLYPEKFWKKAGLAVGDTVTGGLDWLREQPWMGHDQ